MSSSSSSSSSSSTLQGPMIPHDDNAIYNGKFWVFTKNNPGFTNYEGYAVCLNSLLNNKISHMFWSLETGASGTPHLQGYIQLSDKLRWQSIRNKLRGLWVAPAKGDCQQNHDYIGHTGKHSRKPGLLKGPWSYGDAVSAKGVGSRSDLEGMVTAIKDGAKLKTLARDHTNSMLKYFNNASRLVEILSDTERDWMTELYIYYGVAGSGKSHSAYEEAKQYLVDNNIDDEKPYYLPVPVKQSDKLWWEGYTGQSVIIIDDFYGEIGLDYFKRLIDKYPMKVDKKNGSTEFLGRRVYITSNQGWRSWWGSSLLSNSENAAAITRRITVEKRFDSVYGQNNNNNNLDDTIDYGAPLIRRNAMTRSNSLDPTQQVQNFDDIQVAINEDNDEVEFLNLSPIGAGYANNNRFDLA